MKHRVVSFLRTPNWLLRPVFYPKAALFIHLFPVCFFFHLLPYLGLLLSGSLFFNKCLNSTLRSDLSLTTVFILCSSLCRRFHSFCSHQTSSYFIVPLIQMAGGEDVGVSTAWGHPWLKHARWEAPTLSVILMVPKKWMLWLIPLKSRWITWK